MMPIDDKIKKKGRQIKRYHVRSSSCWRPVVDRELAEHIGQIFIHNNHVSAYDYQDRRKHIYSDKPSTDGVEQALKWIVETWESEV